MHTNFFLDPTLARNPPIKRAAYSDRTSWILAEISRLVYQPLPPEVSIKQYVTEIVSAVQRGEHADVVEALVRRVAETDASETGEVADILRMADFHLLEAFSYGGSEALLASLAPREGFEGMLVLAFRGTQLDQSADIISDARANLIAAKGGGRAHKGFLEAFGRVEGPIRAALDIHKGLPLYITGHSLGGALALVATRYLGSDSTGATYTFGCPRVADDVFFESVKTPVYRVVNAADGVTRVPFGYSLTIILALIRLIPINGTRWISDQLRRHFLGYTHFGSLAFLSAAQNVPDEQGIGFKGLTIQMSPDIFWQVAHVLRRWVMTLGKAAISDHSIEEYSLKLLAHAKRRN